MSRTPSYEYELLHQFEIIYRDGEKKTQTATRDYQKVWENVIDDPPDDGTMPVLVYRMNGSVCAALAGLDDLIENEECALEIVRLAADNARLTRELKEAKKYGSWLAEVLLTFETLSPALQEAISYFQFPDVTAAHAAR